MFSFIWVICWILVLDCISWRSFPYSGSPFFLSLATYLPIYSRLQKSWTNCNFSLEEIEILPFSVFSYFLSILHSFTLMPVHLLMERQFIVCFYRCFIWICLISIHMSFAFYPRCNLSSFILFISVNPSFHNLFCPFYPFLILHSSILQFCLPDK